MLLEVETDMQIGGEKGKLFDWKIRQDKVSVWSEQEFSER